MADKRSNMGANDLPVVGLVHLQHEKVEPKRIQRLSAKNTPNSRKTPVGTPGLQTFGRPNVDSLGFRYKMWKSVEGDELVNGCGMVARISDGWWAN
jgi:hypothetical protein